MRSRSTGKIGAARPRSRSTSSTQAAAPAASSIAPSPRLARLADSAPRISRPKAATLSTVARRSTGAWLGSMRGRALRPTTIASTPMGTLTANSHSHEATLNMAEATVGPIAAETEITTAFSPMPRPSSRWG